MKERAYRFRTYSNSIVNPVNGGRHARRDIAIASQGGTVANSGYFIMAE
jgi:hypothetical protein